MPFETSVESSSADDHARVTALRKKKALACLLESDEPAQRTTGAVVFLNAGQTATARVRWELARVRWEGATASLHERSHQVLMSRGTASARRSSSKIACISAMRVN
jgi:hypothetical protein